MVSWVQISVTFWLCDPEQVTDSVSFLSYHVFISVREFIIKISGFLSLSLSLKSQGRPQEEFASSSAS